jgi:enoyl-CoA hydratase/carnithine racemase
VRAHRGTLAAHAGRGQLADLFRDMYGLGKPVVARLRGYALAGGFGLALACDMVVADDDAGSAPRRSTSGCGPT